MRTLLGLCTAILSFAQPVSAQPFKNLATGINVEGPPGSLLVDRDAFPRVFGSLNRTYPPPQAIWIDPGHLRNSPATLQKIQEDQVRLEQQRRAILAELDLNVFRELDAAMIPPVKNALRAAGEVPTLYSGRWGDLEFSRAWRYWIVESARGIPLGTARVLFEDPEGRKSVRTEGHAGNLEPTQTVYVYHVDTHEGLKLLVDTVRRAMTLDCETAFQFQSNLLEPLQRPGRRP